MTAGDHVETGYGRATTDWAFDADGMATSHNSSFTSDPHFQRAYTFGLQIGTRHGTDLHIEWRAWIAIWAARQALGCPGDFVECGVYTGILSGTVCAYLNFGQYADRRFWLLDTFEGLPEDQLLESERILGIQNYNQEYDRPGIADQVRAKFAGFGNVQVVPGRVPDTLSAVTSDRIAYLSLDMNMVYPEIEAAEALWPRIVPGGVILLDDYNQMLHLHQKVRFDQFAAERGVPILGLPTGQGLIIKQGG